jgi:hypothetical protein
MLVLPRDLGVLEDLRSKLPATAQEHFLTLALGCIVAMGRRTVIRILWAIRPLADADPSSYHRFFSATHWSLWTLAKVLAAMVLELVPADQPVIMEGDDTVTRHRGKKVFGKGWHRDAVQSSQGHLHMMLGHKWVVLAINVKLFGCSRLWALPVLTALHVPPPKEPRAAAHGQVRRQTKAGKATDKNLSRSKLPVLRKRDGAGVLQPRCKSPCLLLRQMLAVMIHWFPDRKFILLGDGGFASHDLAWFCRRHRRHVTLIARFCPDAALYTLPSDQAPRKRGPRRTKGLRLPSPQESVAAAGKLRETNLPWYGQGRRDVRVFSACGAWYRCRGSGRGAVVPIRWVYGRETKKGGEGYFYSTDPTLSGEQIITWFTERWCIEVTFQEVRAHLGFHTPRQRCRRSVLRTGPCLLGLFTVVSLIYAQIAKKRNVKIHAVPCYAKTEPTFADALVAVRRVIWDQVILPRVPGAAIVAKIPPRLKNLLLDHLTAAA